jgi:hypothetical protein
MGSFGIHVQALLAAMTGRKSAFSITPKEAQRGNFLFLATPHILYIVVAAGGVVYSYLHFGLTPSLINNTAWTMVNIAIFWPFIWSSLPVHEHQASPVPTPTAARPPVTIRPSSI